MNYVQTADQRVWGLMSQGFAMQCSGCQKELKQGQPYKVKNSLLYCGNCIGTTE